MTLTALLDAGAIGAAAGEDVPCQQEDPELWFAEAPDDVEFAKALCGTCPCSSSSVERVVGLPRRRAAAMRRGMKKNGIVPVRCGRGRDRTLVPLCLGLCAVVGT
jgi:hypothetical protein